jgi:O-acetyl-ADP-ribose deacetylase (regulator of RNase III)
LGEIGMMTHSNIIILCIITAALHAMEIVPEKIHSFQQIVFSSRNRIEKPQIVKPAKFVIKNTILKLKRGCIYAADGRVDAIVIGNNYQKMLLPLNMYEQNAKPHVYHRPSKEIRKKNILNDPAKVMGYIHPVTTNSIKMIPYEYENGSEDDGDKQFFSFKQDPYQLRTKACNKEIKSSIIKINEPYIMPGSEDFYYTARKLSYTQEEKCVLAKCEGKFFLIKESQEMEKIAEDFLLIQEDKNFTVIRRAEKEIFIISDAATIKHLGIETALCNDIEGELLVSGITHHMEDTHFFDVKRDEGKIDYKKMMRVEVKDYNKTIPGNLFTIHDHEVMQRIDAEINNVYGKVQKIEGNIFVIKDIHAEEQKTNATEIISIKCEGQEAIEQASKDLYACYINVLKEGLRIMADKKEKSIALPLLSVELGFPSKQAATVIVNAITDFIKSNPEGYNCIELFVKKRSEFELYQKILSLFIG